MPLIFAKSSFHIYIYIYYNVIFMYLSIDIVYYIVTASVRFSYAPLLCQWRGLIYISRCCL